MPTLQDRAISWWARRGVAYCQQTRVDQRHLYAAWVLWAFRTFDKPSKKGGTK